MKYGAKMLMWAPFAKENAEPEAARPNYGEARNLGELNRVSDSPSFNEAKAYGDNGLARYVNEFKEVGVDVTILDMTHADASAVLGATLAEGEGASLSFGAEDNAPYGGLAFYVNEMLKGNAKKYKGIFYPKVKASMQGEEYTTKGDSITLTGKTLRLVGTACESGEWKVESPYFSTEAEAKEWVNGVFTAG